MSGVETMLVLIDEEDNKVGVVAHNRDEGDIRFFMAHPQAMIGSDGTAISSIGIYANDRPHPRFYGTYLRILGRYVREQPAVLTLEEAVFKMTGFPARRMSFKDRGIILAGNVADLVVFDLETVLDRATYDDPHRFPEGIPHVLVAGDPVVMDRVHTSARPGKVIRRGA
jgi:N-acyl-D-amino-acid deacylase